jgi:hypothetical protein
MERSVPSRRCLQRLVCREVCREVTARDDALWSDADTAETRHTRYSELTFLSLVPRKALEDIILRSSYTELLAGARVRGGRTRCVFKHVCAGAPLPSKVHWQDLFFSRQKRRHGRILHTRMQRASTWKSVGASACPVKTARVARQVYSGWPLSLSTCRQPLTLRARSCRAWPGLCSHLEYIQRCSSHYAALSRTRTRRVPQARPG